MTGNIIPYSLKNNASLSGTVAHLSHLPVSSWLFTRLGGWVPEKYGTSLEAPWQAMTRLRVESIY
jgi:hypothetical protein